MADYHKDNPGFEDCDYEANADYYENLRQEQIAGAGYDRGYERGYKKGETEAVDKCLEILLRHKDAAASGLLSEILKIGKQNQPKERKTEISYCPIKPHDVLITPVLLMETLQTAIDSNKRQTVPIWSGDLEFVKIWIPRLIKKAIENCAEIADEENKRCAKWANENNGSEEAWNLAAATARIITQNIRALASITFTRTGDEPQFTNTGPIGEAQWNVPVGLRLLSESQVKQTDMVIAALVESCKAALNRMKNNSMSFAPEIQQQLKDALALAEDFRKETSPCP